MARRFLEEEQNKLRKRNNAASSIARNITATAKQVKTQQRPVERRTMNISKATVTPKTQSKAQKSTQITQLKKQRNYNQNTWSPVTDPVKEYFSPVPETPKRTTNQWSPVTTPEMDYNPAPTVVPQSTKDIFSDYFLPAPSVKTTPTMPQAPQDVTNVARTGTGDFLNPYAQQSQANKTGQFVNDSGALVGSGLDRFAGNVAEGVGDIGLMGVQNYNANRINDRTNEAGIPEEWLVAANADPELWRHNAVYQAAMNEAARLSDNELANTTWGQLMANLGYNIPGAALSFAAGPLGPWAQRAANMIPMAIGAYGSGLEEKLAEGYAEEYARRYGLLNALNETVFQESIDPFHATFGMPMTLQNMAGEFLQEAAGQAVEPYMNLALRDYENPQELWDAFWATTENEVLTPENAAKALEAGKMGALGAGINAIATNPVGTAMQARADVDAVRDNFTDEYVNLKTGLENQIKELDYVDSPVAKDLQSALQTQVEGLRRNITNKDSDIYTDMMAGIKDQIDFLDTVNTPEAKRTRDVYRTQVENTREGLLQPGALLSSNPTIQKAAMAANRDRVLDQAKQFGVRSDVAEAMATIANNRKIRLNLYDGTDPGEQGRHGTGEEADLVEISSTASDPIGELFAHEFTHDIEGNGLYGAHRQSVYDLLNRGIIKDEDFANVDEVRNAVRKAYGADKSDEYIEREVTAYVTQKLFSDEDAIVALAQENPGLARQIYDSIRETISNGFGATEEELAARDKMNSIRKARDLFKKALEQPQGFSLYYSDDGDDDKNARVLTPLERNKITRQRNGDALLVEQFRNLATNKSGQAFERIGNNLKFGNINSNYAFIDYDHLMHFPKHNATQKEAADKIHAGVTHPALIIDHLTDRDISEDQLLKGDDRQGKGVFFEYQGKPHILAIGHRYNDDIGDFIDTVTSVYELDGRQPLGRRIKKWIADGRRVYTNDASEAFLQKYAPDVTAEELAKGKKNKGYKFSKNLTSNDNELSLLSEDELEKYWDDAADEERQLLGRISRDPTVADNILSVVRRVRSNNPVFQLFNEEALAKEAVKFLNDLGTDTDSFNDYYEKWANNSWGKEFLSVLSDNLANRIADDHVALKKYKTSDVLDILAKYAKTASEPVVDLDLNESEAIVGFDFSEWLENNLVSDDTPDGIQNAYDNLTEEFPELTNFPDGDVATKLTEFAGDKPLLASEENSWGDKFLERIKNDLASELESLFPNLPDYLDQDELFDAVCSFNDVWAHDEITLTDVADWADDFSDYLEEEVGIPLHSEPGPEEWEKLYGPEPPDSYRPDGSKKDMYFSRNVSADAADAILTQGGEPAPSYAFTTGGISNNFRTDDAITLVGRPEAFDPANDKNNHLFSLDIWSPTYLDTKNPNYADDLDSMRPIATRDYEVSNDKFVDRIKQIPGYEKIANLPNTNIKEIEGEDFPSRWDNYLTKSIEEGLGLAGLIRYEDSADYQDEIKSIFSWLPIELYADDHGMQALYVMDQFDSLGLSKYGLTKDDLLRFFDNAGQPGNATPLEYVAFAKNEDQDYIRYLYWQWLSDMGENLLEFSPGEMAIGQDRTEGHSPWLDEKLKLMADRPIKAANFFENKNLQGNLESKFNIVAAAFAKRFNSLDEAIEAGKNQLRPVTLETMNTYKAAKKKWRTALKNVEAELADKPDYLFEMFEDSVTEFLRDTDDSLASLKEHVKSIPELFDTVSDEAIEGVYSALLATRDLPTDMFEAKPMRVMENKSTVAQAYLPRGASRIEEQRFNNIGIKTFRYRNDEEREELIRRYAKPYMRSKNLKKVGVEEALARNPKRIHIPSANDFRADGSIKDLIASHNLTVPMVRKMWRNGGVVSPSIGINYAEQNNQFGKPTDASLIAKQELIDPANPRNLTTRYDSWTPTFPKLHHEINKDNFLQTGSYLEGLDGIEAAAFNDDVLDAFLSEDKEKFDKFMDTLAQYGGFTLFEKNPMMQAVYLINSDMLSDDEYNALQDFLYYDQNPAEAENVRDRFINKNKKGAGESYKKWLHALFDDVTSKETNLVDPVTGEYKPYSMENALELMRKLPKTLARTEFLLDPPESSEYGDTDRPTYQQASGFNAIMGAYGGKFNSLDEVIAARKILQTDRDLNYRVVGADYEVAMDSVIGELHDNYAKGADVDDEERLYAESDKAFGEAFFEFVRGEDHSLKHFKEVLGDRLASCVSDKKLQGLIDVLDHGKQTLKSDLFESKPDYIVTPDMFPQIYLPASELTEEDYEWAKKYGQEIIAFDDTKPATGRNSRDNLKKRYTHPYRFSKDLKAAINNETADMPQDQSLNDLKEAEQAEVEQIVNRTAKRRSKKKGAALYQNVSEDTAQRTAEQIATGAANVTADKTILDDIASSSYGRLSEMGFDKFKAHAYETADIISDNEQEDGFVGPIRKIKNDIRLHNNIADLSVVIQELENNKTKAIDEAEKKGYKFETYTSPEGLTKVRLIDSKETKAAKNYENKINALNEELDNALYKFDTVGHNLGVGLKEFGMFEKMSPARQLQSLQKTVDKMNRELHKAFGGYLNGKFLNKFADGTFEDIVLTEDFKQKYTKAKSQEERANLIEEFGKEISKNYPSTLGEMVPAWRYLMMLGNPVTWIRNTGGNLMEQGAVSSKNVMYYLIEKFLIKNGYIGKNTIDRSNAKDARLFNYAEKTAFSTIADDYAEFKQTKGVSQDAFFRQKGYTGKLLKRLSKYKGSSFSMSSQQKLLNNLNYNVAGALKEQGIKVTNKGKLSKDVDFRKMLSDSYASADKMLMRESGLRHVNAEGGYAKGSREEIKTLENFFNTDKWLQEQQGNKWFDKPTGRGLEHAFNEERRKHVFGRSKVGEVANTASNAVDKILNDSVIGDQSFTRFRFARTMGSILNAQGYGVTTDKDGNIALTKNGKTLNAKDTQRVLDVYKGEALQEAKESVYRNFNAVAQWINKGRRIPGLGLVLDASMPFTTTPMNIVSQAVQYSPAGLLVAFADYNRLGTDQVTPQQFINHLSKSFTGTALMGVGWLLSKLGAIRGFNDDDDKEKKYKKQLGWQDYSLVWNYKGKEHSYTVDWMAPGITPLLMGAAINETLEANGGDLELDETAFSMFEALYQPIADTTMLEGLMNTLGAFGEKHPIREAGKAMITSYAGQFTPAVGARLNKIFDDTARSSYSGNFYENILQQAENKMFLTNLAYKQITGEAMLEPQLNAKGEEVKNIGGSVLGRAAYNLLSPGKYSTNTADNYDNELLRLYESDSISDSAKNGLLPSQIYTMGGESLKPKDRTELNKYYLQNYRSQLEGFMDSPMYQASDDDTRAKMLSSLRDYYYAKTKERYYGSVSPDASNVLTKTQATVSELEKVGIAPYQSLYYGTIKSDKDASGETIKNSRALKVRQMMELEGNYDTVLGLINSGKISAGDVGLSKTVIGMDRSTFMNSYDALADGTYTGYSTDSDGKKKSPKRRPSGRSSRSSKSSSSNMDKLYQKLYDMAMKGTLDSIGDIAASMNKSAKTTVKDLVDDGSTTHEQLINELEKMIAQQTKRPN